MAKQPSSAGLMTSVNFDSLRNITCPTDKSASRTVLTGTMPISSIKGLPVDQNVREYLVDAAGKKRRTSTSVHRAIRATLEQYPDMFCALNGGFVMVAQDYDVDDKSKVVHLLEPSIINGAQTQGVIEDFLGQLADDEKVEAYIRFECIITTDTESVADISIARNSQNDVKQLSIAGRKGQLDELNNVVKFIKPLRLSESHYGDDYIDTEHLLQLCVLLIPKSLWPEKRDYVKNYAYSQRAKVLKDFQSLQVAANGGPAEGWITGVDKKKVERLYKFYLDIAPIAIELHEKWKSHPALEGKKLMNAVKRGEDGTIDYAHEGFIFPILAAHAPFLDGTLPKKYGDALENADFCADRLVSQASKMFTHVAASKPHEMGRTRACYETLHDFAEVFAEMQR